jgi:hypothetical protein
MREGRALHRSKLFLLSPARGRGWERGLRTSIPPLLASPPSGGEEHEREEKEVGEKEEEEEEEEVTRHA